METVTRWCGIAVLGFVVGCGSQGPSPQGSPPAGTPESGGTPAAEAPSERRKVAQPAAPESAPPPQIAPVPDDESTAPPATAVKQPGPC